MPTYEYACKQCGEHLDVVQKFTDDALTTCSSCGGSLRKVFGNIGISFKGSGFYKNDSRSSDNGAKKKDEPAAKSGEGSSSGGSEGSGKSEGSSDSKGSGDSKGKDGAKAGSTPKASTPTAAS